MAQYRTDQRKLDGSNLVTRYEVMMLNDVLTPSGTLVDAFGRLRISQPFTLFDSQNRYRENDKFSTSNTAYAFTTYKINESAVDLTVKTQLNAEVIKESKRVFSYQPGKSLLVLNTFAMSNNNYSGLRQRVGYFNSNNGIFLERVGSNNYIVLRSKSTGTVVDTRVPQSQWNADTFSNSSSYAVQTSTRGPLDVTKTNIFWMDIEWLGVGDVRTGFVVEGKFLTAHIFHNHNVIYQPYMTTATLPIRYEIKNTVATTSNSSLKQICSAVMSEGGYEKMTSPKVFRTTSNTTIQTAFTPILSIRLASDRLDSVIIPSQVDFFPVSTDNFEVALFKNATLSGANYNTSYDDNVDYDVAATTMSGGSIIEHFYSSSTNQGTGMTSVEQRYNFDLQLGRTTSGTSDVYTLAARVLKSTGTGTCLGAIKVYDLTD